MDKYFPWAFLVLVFYGHLHFVIVMSTSQYVTKVWRHYENIGFSSNFLAFAFSNSFAKLKSLHTMISVLIFYYLLLTNQLPYPKQQRKTGSTNEGNKILLVSYTKPGKLPLNFIRTSLSTCWKDNLPKVHIKWRSKINRT